MFACGPQHMPVHHGVFCMMEKTHVYHGKMAMKNQDREGGILVVQNKGKETAGRLLATLFTK